MALAARLRPWLRAAGFTVAVLGVQTAAAEPKGESWSVASNSLFFVKVFKDSGTIGSGMAHDHVVRAAHFQATLQFDAADPASCRLSLVVPVRELAVDEDWLRQQ